MSSAGADVRRRTRLLAPLVVAAVVLLDQVTKAWIVAVVEPDNPVQIVGHDVELHLTRNTGGAFSTFQSATPLLAILAVVLSVVLVRAVRRARDPWLVVALSLVLGGALGNLGDRLFRSPGFLRGAVVDFVRVYSFPSFNVADSAITIGAVLLVVGSLLGRWEST